MICRELGLEMVSKARQQFAENLVRIRKERQITQTELAKAVKVTPGQISLWENQESWVGDDKLDLLARALQCTYDDLLSGKNSSKVFSPLPIQKTDPLLPDAIRVVNNNLDKIVLKKANKRT